VVFCSSICRDRWSSGAGHELSRRAKSVAHQRRKAIKQAEQKADESLKRFIDEETTLTRIRLEEKIGKHALSENKPSQVMLIRPELERPTKTGRIPLIARTKEEILFDTIKRQFPDKSDGEVDDMVRRLRDGNF
jgi:seryl-tRNA(Sec) selenium transferase